MDRVALLCTLFRTLFDLFCEPLLTGSQCVSMAWSWGRVCLGRNDTWLAIRREGMDGPDWRSFVDEAVGRNDVLKAYRSAKHYFLCMVYLL